MKQNQDHSHLKLLSIFHYVVGGMTALFSLFPIIHIIIGIAMVSGAFEDSAAGTPPPPELGWLFIAIGSIVILVGLCVAAAMALAGNRLSRRSNYYFCLTVAAIECIFMPFGTVLGVFTIIVLMRDSVRSLFGVDQ